MVHISYMLSIGLALVVAVNLGAIYVDVTLPAMRSMVIDTSVSALPPLAGDDRSDVTEDVSVFIPVLLNDKSRDAALDTSSLVLDSHDVARHGIATTGAKEGYIHYQPHRDFYGLDSFSYNICDLQGLCASAKVFVEVHPINDPPYIKDDHVVVDEDGSIEIDLLANDHDTMDAQSMDPGSLEILQPPRYGALTLESTQQVKYVPDANYFGGDFFVYQVCEQNLEDEPLCGAATVYLKVSPKNDVPEAVPDYDTTYQDLPTVIDVLSNDQDSIDRRTVTFQLSVDGLRPPMHGSAFVDTDVQLIIYTPDDGFVGEDRFFYRICDRGPGVVLCDTSVVEMIILPSDLDQQVLGGSVGTAGSE